MTRLNINCFWGPALTEDEALATQVSDFARRLSGIHPLLGEIAITGAKDGFANMMGQPLISSLQLSDWGNLLSESRDARGVVVLNLWNRRSSPSEFISCTIHANDNAIGNGVSLNGLPEPLNNAESIQAIMHASIDVFRPRQAMAYTYWQDEKLWARCWTVWTPQHVSILADPETQFFPEQGPHRTIEPWLGGLLYTWPEYAPWTYRQAASSA
ncbi:MAG: hypothetical protein QM759_04735 [Terricaulis sp.]